MSLLRQAQGRLYGKGDSDLDGGGTTDGKDNTVWLGGHSLQLLPGPVRSCYARARVEIQEWRDRSVVVAYPVPINPGGDKIIELLA